MAGPETPPIVLTDAAATLPTDDRCPRILNGRRCTGGREHRVLSAGFGEPHDVCRLCGFDYPERTL